MLLCFLFANNKTIKFFVEVEVHSWRLRWLFRLRLLRLNCRGANLAQNLTCLRLMAMAEIGELMGSFYIRFVNVFCVFVFVFFFIQNPLILCLIFFRKNHGRVQANALMCLQLLVKVFPPSTSPSLLSRLIMCWISFAGSSKTCFSKMGHILWRIQLSIFAHHSTG